jgi:PilZ domain/Gram-negative bacterial TonB protein C-terminal
MSTSTEYMDGLNAPAERRFYPRVSPPTPIYVAFGSNNLGVLHNVSENGFQVATPSELPLNSVFRVFLSLNGAAKTIAVTVRTVWTVDAEKRSGIQLLDLSDENREQIRQWVEFEMSRSENSTPWFQPKDGDSRSVGASPRASEMPRMPRIVLPTTAEAPAVQLPVPAQSKAASYTTAQGFPAEQAPPIASQETVQQPVAEESAGLPPIANPFDDPGPNPQFDQFPPVPLPIHGQFEYAPPSSSGRSRRRASSRLRAKPLVLWAAALALICFGANALVRYRISSTSRRFASESAKYTPPKSDADPISAAPPADSGSNAAASADAQPATNSAADSSSDSSTPSSTDSSTKNAPNDASAAVPASRSAAKNSETTQPDPRRGSSLDADARSSRAYAATAPPADRAEESARESQPSPTPKSWSAPAPIRSPSAVSASDAPQSPNVVSSSNAPVQSNSAAIVSQARPVPPATPPVQTATTSGVSNSASSSTSNSVVNNPPSRTQPPANSQQSSTYASNTNTAAANTAPPARPQSQIYNANTPAQRSAIMSSINSVHPSGIFDSNDSTSSSTNSVAPAPSRSASANVATRSVSNSYVAPSDVPQDRDIEIPAPKGFNASWVDLPGEHLVRSAAGTVHIHRMVRVPGERIPGQRWLWRGRLDVTLGDVVNRIDPSAVQASGASGSLTVMASIDKDGYVTDLKPLNGNFALLPAVSRTVRNWHYEPTYLDNKRAETQAQIEFDLRPVPVSASNRGSRP